jgi:phage portal protein BeeE
MANSHFWQTVRKAAQAVSQTLNGPGKDATSLQRAAATGHTTNYAVGNTWEELGHMTGWNFPAINAIASQWENASVCMYAKKQKMVKKSSSAQDEPDEQRTPIHDHPLLDLLERPNPVFWREIFFYQLATHYCLTGGFVIWEVRNGEGKPCELWALPRAWLTFQTGTEQFPLGLWRVFNQRGLSSYSTLNQLQGGFYIDIRDTIILNRPHPLYPGEPLGTLTACAKIVDIAEQHDNAVWSSLLESPRPGMILSVKQQSPATSEQLARMQAVVQSSKGGTNNAGKLWVMENVEMSHMGTPLADLDSTAGRKQGQEFLQAIHSVPPIATGIRTETGSYAADAATINTWIELHIQTMLNRLAGCFNHRFHRYWPNERLEISAKRADDPLLQKDRSDSIKDAVSKGLATGNEWRGSMKLPPMPGLDEIKEPTPPPVPGMPGQPGEQPPGNDLDLGDEAPDQDSTGIQQPTNGVANRLPAYLTQPTANGVAH